MSKLADGYLCNVETGEVYVVTGVTCCDDGIPRLRAERGDGEEVLIPFRCEGHTAFNAFHVQKSYVLKADLMPGMTNSTKTERERAAKILVARNRSPLV